MTSSRYHRPPYKGGASTITGYTADLPPLYNIMDLMNGSKPALHNPYNGTYSAEMYSKEAVNIIKQYATPPSSPPSPSLPIAAGYSMQALLVVVLKVIQVSFPFFDSGTRACVRHNSGIVYINMSMTPAFTSISKVQLIGQ